MKKDYENIMPYNDGWKQKRGPLGFRNSKVAQLFKAQTWEEKVWKCWRN